ncbi:MAG TPA: glycosyltransferase [Solirubrobacteraceae bacterium]|jgi:glycosyltransferase involved in cell wall biosynthesis|nr:glycosyltransferase [Solirubrobacteraceae bacterium]
MRILVFHGYLLSGTGSNVYNARLAAALVKLGHEVHLLSQDRHPERQPFVDAMGDWDEDALRVRALRERVRCTVYRPNIGGLLPVYVADRYEGIEARTFAECSDAEVASYLDANVAAVRELVARVSPDVALANHLVMGPVILARALADRRSRRSSIGGEVPYAVKVHGSALEYTVKPHPERFLDLAREGVAGAGAVLVGSHHTAASLWAALEDPVLPQRTRLGPPGVDVDQFAPRDRAHARKGLLALSSRLGAGGGGRPSEEIGDRGGAISGEDAFARDDSSAARALARIDPERDRLVAFVGKLIVSKGCDLLLAAWPLVLERVPAARLVVVGFGAYRPGLERLLVALSSGDIAGARKIALAGRSLEAQPATGPSPPPFEPQQPLRHLLAFLDGLSSVEGTRYLAAARALPGRVLFTGRLDHDELTDLLPACEALIAPSTFPEAFGMVAAEAAACGALPISASHSGLAEVSGALARAVPDSVAPWLSFPVDDSSVGALAERILAWLTVDEDLRERARAGLVRTVRERWSWEGVARGVIAAARGELDALAEP